MMFDEIKTAMFCDIFWKLLEFDPEMETIDPDRQTSLENGKNSQDSNV